VATGSKNSRARGSSDPHKDREDSFRSAIVWQIQTARKFCNLSISLELKECKRCKRFCDGTSMVHYRFVWLFVGLFFGGGRGCWKK
jgi:hypothetical protein